MGGTDRPVLTPAVLDTTVVHGPRILGSPPMSNLSGIRALRLWAVVLATGAPGDQVPVLQTNPLSPPVLPNRSRAARTVEVTLTAAPARLSIAPGTETEVFAY